MDIVNTPVTEDITTLVYKVNSYIKKVPGSNFTNYYLYDLDGIDDLTGTIGIAHDLTTDMGKGTSK